MKLLHVAGIAGAIVAIAIAILFVVPVQVTRSYHAGAFTVNVLEDSGRRFLARVENSGPAIENAAAFAVKKGLNGDCEPQGIVAANFKLENKDGKPVMTPSSIPGSGSVTIDSAAAGISQIPPSTDVTVYVMKVDTGSMRATEVVEKIPIQQSNQTDLQQFESCLAKSGSGYPLLFRLTNIPKSSLSYFTVDDGKGRYETSLRMQNNAPDFAAIYWPDARQNWSQGNFTRPAGPAPAWKEPQAVTVNVKTVLSGRVQEFEKQLQLSDDRLETASLDFFEVANGNVVPVYPEYWEIKVDLQNRAIS